MKPLSRKNYGSIGHLPNSRLGPGDHSVTEGQARIACEKKRDKYDIVIVQEKLDGSNVGVCKVNGEIFAITRSGYVANTSPYRQHHLFGLWVEENKSRFNDLLRDGERVCGEWLAMAHGTIYRLEHEPFVAFDLMTNDKRVTFEEFKFRCRDFVMPAILSIGDAFSVESALLSLSGNGYHGACEEVEGAIWRVERNGSVDFLTKYVRPTKQDGKYFKEFYGRDVWNFNLESYVDISHE